MLLSGAHQRHVHTDVLIQASDTDGKAFILNPLPLYKTHFLKPTYVLSIHIRLETFSTFPIVTGK